MILMRTEILPQAVQRGLVRGILSRGLVRADQRLDAGPALFQECRPCRRGPRFAVGRSRVQNLGRRRDVFQGVVDIEYAFRPTQMFPLFFPNPFCAVGVRR